MKGLRILYAGSGRDPLFLSLSPVMLWWQMKRCFNCLFLLEVDAEIIGLIGMYDLTQNNSGYLSLLIFDGKDRGKGYGTQAYELFLSRILKSMRITTLHVQIEAANIRAVNFWRRRGFGSPEPLGRGLIRLSATLHAA
jgi:RimJ/RimL family protein N-acetyltransferase